MPLVIILLCQSCAQDASIESIKKKSFLQKNVDHIVAGCDNLAIEFPFLYDSLATVLPEDSAEHLQIVSLLKNKGFKVTQYGRGNYHPKGPRIITVDLTNGDCHCTVSKKYYSTIEPNQFEMTESIQCKKSGFE